MDKDTLLIVGVLLVAFFLYQNQQTKTKKKTPGLRSQASRGSYVATARRTR